MGYKSLIVPSTNSIDDKNGIASPAVRKPGSTLPSAKTWGPAYVLPGKRLLQSFSSETHRRKRPGMASLFAIAFIGSMGLLSSCNWSLKASFPAAKIAEDLKKMCDTDYKLPVDVRKQGDALQVFLWRVGLLKAGVSGDPSDLRPEAAQALEQVLLCATRVVLSTDAALQFVEIKMMDVRTGGTITLWRYVPDIRDSMYTRMGEDEFLNRLVIEEDPGTGRSASDHTIAWDPPITMEEFIAKQIILRAKRQSPVGLLVHEDLSVPSSLVVVVDNWAAIHKQEPDQEDKIADAVEKSAQSVFKAYSYKGFRGLVLQDGEGILLKRWTL